MTTQALVVLRVSSPRRGQTGFALVTVLIAVSVIMSYIASYGRHVIVEGRWSHTSAQLVEAQETCHSGLSLARQSLVSGQDLQSGPLEAGAGAAQVLVLPLVDGVQQLEVQALGSDGLGVQQVVELAFQPSAASSPAGPEELPALAPFSLSALVASQAVEQFQVQGYERLESTEVLGVLVIHPGAVLELDDVIIQGAIVSASALDPDAQSSLVFDPVTAPTVIFDGNVRIDATSSLAGLAVLMPDGVLEGASADTRLELHGDVIAHTVDLPQSGVLDGNVSSVEPPQLSPGLDTLGRDRKPAGWSEDLDLGGALEPVSLAFVPQSWSLAQLEPIIAYWE